MTPDQLEQLLVSNEDERLEFKEARTGVPFDKPMRHCSALANEEGGAIINTSFSLIDNPDGRLLIFHVPRHPQGNPVKADGIYWRRRADSLVPMSEDRLLTILAEAGHDFSADICPNAVSHRDYQLPGNIFVRQPPRRLVIGSTGGFPPPLKPRLHRLVSMGIIERFGRGRGARHLLCRRHYKITGEKCAYTRNKVLDRETNKALPLKNIEENKDTGSRLSEVIQVPPALSDNQVKKIRCRASSRGENLPYRNHPCRLMLSERIRSHWADKTQMAQ